MRKPDVHSRRLGPIRVYRGELDQISALAAGDGKVEFRCDGFVYDSIDELAHHRKPGAVRSLVIQPIGGDGAAAVSIAPHQVEVFALSESPVGADQISALLRGHARAQPMWWRVVFGALGWLVSIVLGVLVWRMSDLPTMPRALVGGFVAVFSVSLLSAIQRSLGESAVYLHRREDPGLRSQRGPLLFVAAASGLIGLAIGVLLT